MLEYAVQAKRMDTHGGVASTKEATVILDTDVNGRRDAFNPAELLLAAVAACILKGIERVTPLLNFRFRGVEVRLHAVRQESPPKLVSIAYEIVVDTDEADHRLDLLHNNVKKYGTVFNTVALGTELSGVLRRAG